MNLDYKGEKHDSMSYREIRWHKLVNLMERADKAEAALERARALLKRIEFKPVCPACLMYRLAGAPREGHTDDCVLAALLS